MKRLVLIFSMLFVLAGCALFGGQPVAVGECNGSQCDVAYTPGNPGFYGVTLLGEELDVLASDSVVTCDERPTVVQCLFELPEDGVFNLTVAGRNISGTFEPTFGLEKHRIAF